jgi:hypothetical protein
VKTEVVIWLAMAFIMEAGAFPQGGSCFEPGPTPAPASTDDATDIDGNVYSTVLITFPIQNSPNLQPIVG